MQSITLEKTVRKETSQTKKIKLGVRELKTSKSLKKASKKKPTEFCVCMAFTQDLESQNL